VWISDAPKATLSEIKGQLGELKRLLGQLESDIRDQLKKPTGTQPLKQRSPNAVAKARDLADQEIDTQYHDSRQMDATNYSRWLIRRGLLETENR
jgi:hypothetical protein